MSSTLSDDLRIRRQIWFTIHVLIYCGIALLQVMIWPGQPLLLLVKSALLLTLSLHVYDLYTGGLKSLASEPIPATIHSGEPQSVRVDHTDPEQDFWYRWHDV
jgi:hypothetical protein